MRTHGPTPHPSKDRATPAFREPSSWGVAMAIAITIVICLAAFIWIFVSLEPAMSDFIAEDALATPTAQPLTDET